MKSKTHPEAADECVCRAGALDIVSALPTDGSPLVPRDVVRLYELFHLVE
ncbi:MAG: hypothetical protein Q8P56_01500 [Candidatus Uhrbacteria bacterium]|nr:hypothetical protein [Candidatus Uhrbacteria bacterium]